MVDIALWRPFIVVIVTLFGLVIGSFLNVVIYRVPNGRSLLPASRCPHCDYAIRPWQNIPVLSWLLLRARCAGCQTRISARYPLVETGTGLAFAAITCWLFPALATQHPLPWILTLIAYLQLAACTIALALIDIDTYRLPNTIVATTTLALLALLGAAAISRTDYQPLIRALIGGLALAAIYLTLRVLWKGGMGLGDVKLAIPLGAAMAWLSWGAYVTGAFAAFLYGGIFGILILAMRKGGMKSAIPFGPWMILGAWTGIFFGDTIAHWYLGTFFPN